MSRLLLGCKTKYPARVVRNRHGHIKTPPQTRSQSNSLTDLRLTVPTGNSEYGPTMSRRLLTPLYAALAVGALVATWWHNIAYFREGGTVSGFLTEGYANHVAASLINDLWFLLAAVFVFMLVDARRNRVRYVWLYIVLSFATAISVMFPLYLIARERKLHAT